MIVCSIALQLCLLTGHDTHITKILSEIREHPIPSVSTVSMPTKVTKYGFPVVHELERMTATEQLPPLQASPGAGKMSLFARQFDSHTPDYFGLDQQQLSAPPPSCVARDRVEPFALGMSTAHELGADDKDQRGGEEGGDDKANSSRSVSELDSDISSAIGPGGQPVTAPSGRESSVREEFSSEASRTWDRFVSSQLISGAGLVKVGVSPEAAHGEVGKIHRENVERLSGMLEKEILQERERIEQALGPSLVSFMRARRGREGGAGGEVPAMVAHGGEEGREKELAMEEGEPPPSGWLHMGTVEREKMEWMTDVPTHGQASQVQDVQLVAPLCL